MPHDLTRRGLIASSLITGSYLILGERVTLTPAQAAELNFTPEVLTPSWALLKRSLSSWSPGRLTLAFHRIWTPN